MKRDMLNGSARFNKPLPPPPSDDPPPLPSDPPEDENKENALPEDDSDRPFTWQKRPKKDDKQHWTQVNKQNIQFWLWFGHWTQQSELSTSRSRISGIARVTTWRAWGEARKGSADAICTAEVWRWKAILMTFTTLHTLSIIDDM